MIIEFVDKNGRVVKLKTRDENDPGRSNPEADAIVMWLLNQLPASEFIKLPVIRYE